MRLFRWQHTPATPATPADAAYSIQHIRQHMAALGYDLGDATDEEIHAGVLRFGAVIQAAQLTTQDAANALVSLAAAQRSLPDADKG